jgi:hypothetical protein
VNVNFFSAMEVGHMAPSSRFPLSLKPDVAYFDLNFCALYRTCSSGTCRGWLFR